MAASRQTVFEIYAVLRNYVPPEKLTRMLSDLGAIDGNRSFEGTVGALRRLHAATAVRA